MIKTALAPLSNPESEILILGTMPGERSIALRQYYANRGNRFWKIIFSIFGEEFSSDYVVRTALLRKHKIALWNVLAECQHEGSRDTNIKNETANDFTAFFDAHPSIKFVFFESKAAEKFYAKYAHKKPGVLYRALPSTSGLNAAVPHAQKLAEWQILSDCRRGQKIKEPIAPLPNYPNK